ncbi:MAG: GEVED domain-containing protein [Bacteroidota bacterium]
MFLFTLFLFASFMANGQVGGKATANNVTGVLNVTCGSGVSFAVDSGVAPADNIAFYWEFSVTGAVDTYNAFTTQGHELYTNPYFFTSDQGYYRRVTIKKHSIGGDDFFRSTPVLVTSTYVTLCHCHAGSRLGNYYAFPVVYPDNIYGILGNVTFNTLDNSSLSPGAVPGAICYTSYLPMGTSVNKGVSYALSVTVAGQTQAEVWFDWNQNGIFENNATEYKFLGTLSVNLASETNAIFANAILVPANAVSGTTTMRLRASASNLSNIATQACGDAEYGEVEDYQITVGNGTACSGLPPIAVTTASATNVCPGTSVNFGLSTINNSTGISYQWYNNAGAIPGATNCVYSKVITAADNFHCDITCSNSGQTRSSTTVPVSLKAWNCFCKPSANLNPFYYDEIANVTFSAPINPINNSSVGSSTHIGYSDYTALPNPPSVPVNSTVPFLVTTRSEDYGHGWIDYNHSRTFEESEAFLIADGTVYDPLYYIHPGTVTIPATALLGPTLMRFRMGETPGAFPGLWALVEPKDPCLYYVRGEAEDYLVNITAPCTGAPPAPGNTLASANPACINTNVKLSMQNASPYRTGITYQWYNTSGPVPGATDSVYTIIGFTAADTYFCKVTCANSGASAFSAAIGLTVNSPANCSCTASSSAAPAINGYSAITNVTFKTLNNTTTVPAAAPFYTSYAPMGTSVNRGTLYPENLLSVTIAQYGKAGAWFDWNRNGVFENNANEFVYLGNNPTATPVTFTQTVNVPANAVPGITPMRVRSEYFLGSLDGSNACGTTVIGETEDYAITVIDTTARTYTFTGNGNWNVASNWANNAIPPAILSGNDRININPAAGGECVLNIVQRVSNVAQITVKAGKKMRIVGNLIVNK